MACSHQPSTRRSRQRYTADPLLHLLYVVDQPREQGCLRSDAQPGHCCTHGDLHHLDRMRAPQTTPWRGSPFGSLVTWPIWARCQYHRFDIHQLVGELIVRPPRRFRSASSYYLQFFWAFWPSTYHIDSSTFNWACPLFLIFLGCALLTFRYHGRHAYGGPVTITDAYTPEVQH